MRLVLLSVMAMLSFAGTVRSQQESSAVALKPVLVGFPSYVPEESAGRFKIGLWTPLSVEIEAGAQDVTGAELLVETTDSEDVPTLYKLPVGKLAKGERRTVLAYSKPGNSDGRFKLSLRRDGRDLLDPVIVTQTPLDLAGRLYLTAGARLPALQDALVLLQHKRSELTDQQSKRDTFPRYAAVETDPTRLPALALGYDGVDLLILTTGDKKFVEGLLREPARIRALSHWVRQGGRLVISISWRNQIPVSQLLKMSSWQPPVPVTPPAVEPDPEKQGLSALKSVTDWAHVSVPFPLPGEDPVPMALLQEGKRQNAAWEVLAESEGQPLIGRMPYGRGSITLIAFELDKEPFSTWLGRKEFLRGLISNLEPRVPQRVGGGEQAGVAIGQTGAGQDLTTQLQTTLDRFDVPTVPFGWVALLILIYVLLVGPLDYFVLKKFFKGLQWTWLTFPAVVVAVSVLSYMTAYAVKGRDLKINQIDLLDCDLRTELDDNLQTKKAYVCGRSWFSIMSPGIQSYTIGIEPALVGDKSAMERLVSWLGRPELEGYGAMGRPRAQSWSNRSYAYAPDAIGLTDVPLPAWTTKSFTAAWSAPLTELPVVADLKYFNHGDVKVSGSIRSMLPGDLEDVWVFYRNQCFPLPEKILPRRGDGKGRGIEVILAHGRTQDIQHWPTATESPPQPRGLGDPTPLIKDLMFHERIDSGANQRNQAAHRLDLSWRLQEEPKSATTNVREVILFGRLAAVAGNADEVIRRQSLGARLKINPLFTGALVQDTYVRIILPVRPGD